MTKEKKGRKNNVPLGRNEDVEYSEELADSEDREAQERAAAADKRATKK